MQNVRPTIGIDIGNSGLRIAQLDLSTCEIGQTERITWSHAIATDHSQVSAGPRPQPARFQPGSEDWLAIIERFCAGVLNTQTSSSIAWRVSSVRRDALAVLEGYVAGTRPADAWQVVTRHQLPIEVDVLEPDRVGIDRLLAATAASKLVASRPLIVMQVGSAMTVDLIREPHVYCGGAILPGVPMMLRLLGQAADLLPQIEATELTELPALPGRNTEQAMRCGTASALVGGAQHLVQRYREKFGAETKLIISGGDGHRLAQHMTGPHVTIDHLVLRGLMYTVS